MPKSQTTSDLNKATVLRWINEMYGEKHWELMHELAGPFYTRHEPTGTQTVNIEEHVKRIKDLYGETEKNPNDAYQSIELFAEGDKVCIIGKGKFYRKGEDNNLDLYNWLQVFRLKDGKIVETWFPGFVKIVEW